MRTVKTSIGFRIERLRRYLRVSQEGVGKTLGGRSRQYVADIEKDERSPTMDELKLIAVMFRLPNFDISYLVYPEKYLEMGRFKITGEEQFDPYSLHPNNHDK